MEMIRLRGLNWKDLNLTLEYIPDSQLFFVRPVTPSGRRSRRWFPQSFQADHPVWVYELMGFLKSKLPEEENSRATSFIRDHTKFHLVKDLILE